MVGESAGTPPVVKSNKGRKPGQCPKYTIGIGYVILYRYGKTPEQIAKIFKKDVGAVKASLSVHGVDLVSDSEKKVKKMNNKIAKMEAELARLKAKVK